MMKLGVVLPQTDIGGDPSVLRDFVQTAESLGYAHLGVAEHVLGVNRASRPDWGERNDSEDLFHDPFALLSYLAACTRTIELSTQVLILPQRQAVLVAKQAASLDMLSGGRLRLGIGVGWNAVEFVGLNENFHDRGRRSEEQIAVMQALWAEQHVSFTGKWHRIEDAGINPRPVARQIPLWFGGHVDATLRRIAKFGDGWMMLAYPPGPAAIAEFDTLRRYVEAAGRDPARIGIEVWTSTADGDEAAWRETARFWKQAGITHLTLNNTFGRYYHTRMAESSLAAHLAALRCYHEVVADLL